VVIRGISTFHDSVGGTRAGKNLVFTVTMDRITLCHCGDLGHILTPEQLAEIGPVDILLVSVGGTVTLDYHQAAEVVRQIRPTIIHPMHFRTRESPMNPRFPLDTAQNFLCEMGGGRTIRAAEIDLQKETLSAYAGVILLDYA
jgi:L-ascorbate metabolism protein UlaG (beta-lactamase superfamily)